MRSTPRTATEPELLHHFYPFSPSEPGQLFPSLQLTHNQKKSLQELVGKEVRVHFAYSTTYHYEDDEETYSNAYDYWRNGLTGILEGVLGFSRHFLSHIVLGFSPSPAASRVLSRRRVIPLEHQEREGNITATSLLKELDREHTSFSFLSHRLYWEERDIATLVSVPPARLGLFFHALEHSYGHCLKNKRYDSSIHLVGAANSKPNSKPSLARPCPYRLGQNDVGGILQQYLHRLTP